jgi:hypothetical protein
MIGTRTTSKMIIIISFRRCSQRTRPKRVCGYERYLDYLHRHEIPESSRADEVPFMHDGGTIVIAQRAP